MRKIALVIFINILFIFSYSQISKDEFNLNHLRKLELELNETILIGFDNYKEQRNSQKLNLSFETYFLINSNISDTDFINETFKDSFNISVRLYNSSETYINERFICSKTKIHPNYNSAQVLSYYYYIVKYDCIIESFISFNPKIVSLNSSEIKFSNNEIITNISPFAYFIQNDLTKIKNIKTYDFFKSDIYYCDDGFSGYNNYEFKFLKNSKIIEHKGTYFKIKGNFGCEDRYNCDNDFKSENIKLILMDNNRPVAIQCKGYCDIDREDDKDYYYLETTGINPDINSTLQYAIANFTKKNYTIMLDFKNFEDSRIKKAQEIYKKKGGGLSTGGIIAVTIPCLIVLLGVAGLVFFLLKKPMPAPLPAKIMNNNTIGVASSEAVVQK